MRIAAQYSFKNGLDEVSERYPHLLTEVKGAITAVDALKAKTKWSREKTKVGRALYSPAAFNKAFQKELYPKGWKKLSVNCEYPTTHYLEDSEIRSTLKGAFRGMDFVKDGLGVEVQSDESSLPVCSMCAKMTIFRNLGFINCGIEIVLVKALALEMSSGVSYFEQFVWDLESRGVADIDIPVLIIGIDT